jgi:hypothetical protein
MNVLLWIMQILLAVAFLGAGGMKLARSRAQLVQAMPPMKDLSAGQIKGIGVAEVAGAIGVVLPWATGIAPVLTPLAAVGLLVVMIGAVVTHARRGDPQTAFVAPLVLGLLAAIVAIGRF